MGSSPSGRANPILTRVSDVSPSPKPGGKANAHQLGEAVEAFLVCKHVAGCPARTVGTYEWWLRRFIAAIAEVTPLTVRGFFVGLQDHSPSHQHQSLSP